MGLVREYRRTAMFDGKIVAKKDSKVEFEASSHNIRSKRIDVRGEVDVNSAPILLEQIQAAIAKRYEVIIINLSQVTRMDSAGVAVLIEGINEARKEKIILSLAEVSKAAQSVLEMARVDKLFQVSGKNYLPPRA
jgi:anti-sigma B factor antagonist